MSNPVVVEVTRGGIVESAHRGAYAVFDADGRCVTSGGDIARPVFPRSAVKAMQALPLVESGAADRFGFGDRELALASASHSAEEAHRQLALSMLERAGLVTRGLGLTNLARGFVARLLGRLERGDMGAPGFVEGQDGRRMGGKAAPRQCGVKAIRIVADEFQVEHARLPGLWMESQPENGHLERGVPY